VPPHRHRSAAVARPFQGGDCPAQARAVSREVAQVSVEFLPAAGAAIGGASVRSGSDAGWGGSPWHGWATWSGSGLRSGGPSAQPLWKATGERARTAGASCGKSKPNCQLWRACCPKVGRAVLSTPRPCQRLQSGRELQAGDGARGPRAPPFGAHTIWTTRLGNAPPMLAFSRPPGSGVSRIIASIGRI
jgi:hypothetical protein